MTRVFVLAAFVLLLSCKQKKKQYLPVKYNSSTYKVGLIDTDQKIKIPLDQFTLPVTNCLQLIGDSLAFLRDNSIVFMDIEKKTIRSAINFYEKDKQLIDKICSFLFVSSDSIFLITNDPRYIYMGASDGSIKDRFTVMKPDDNFYPSCSASAGGAKMILSDNKLFYNITSLFLDPDDIQDQLEETGSTMALNLKTRQIGMLPVLAGDLHNWNSGNEPYPSVVSDGKRLIYSFLSNHNVYGFNGKDTQAMDASSDFFSGFMEDIEGDNTTDFKKYLTKILKGDEYGFITYDPYRQVYYRFMYLGFTPDKNSNLKKSAYMRPQFTIIILDKDLKKIGETQMPNERHVAFNHFVNEDGFYISNNHFLNEDSDEDTLSFSLYRLENLPAR